jgi:hypothetical protein
MADLADRLASDHGPAVYAALRMALREQGASKKKGALDPAAQLGLAADEHEKVEKGLRRLRRLMREWQSYDGVVRGLKRLRDDESRIVSELKEDDESSEKKR